MKVHSNRIETVEILEVCVETRNRGQLGGFSVGYQRMTPKELLTLMNSSTYYTGDTKVTDISGTGQYVQI